MKKITFILILIIAFSCFTFAVSAASVTEPALETAVVTSGTCGASVNWTLTADGTLTISGKGAMEDLFNVSAQPWKAYKAQITKVVVEEGVVSIGRNAFYGHTAITEVVLPESLMAIEEYAFFGCTGITEMTIPAKVFYIGKMSLRKTNINTITFANAEGWAFIDGTTVDMGDNDALVAALRKIPATYEQTFMRTFEAEGTVIAGGEFGKSLKWTLSDTGVLTVTGEGAMPKFNVNTTPWYGYRGAIRTVVIGDGITSVGRCSFHTCRAIVSVTLPETIETIAEYAFYNMPYITEISIPSAVTRIEAFVLRKCASLETVEMGIYYGWTTGTTMPTAAELYNTTVDAFVKTYYKSVWERDVNAPFEDVNDPYFVAAGACNSYTSWKLVYIDEAKTQMKLTVSGNGKMPSFGTGATPWIGYADSIVEIEVQEGVTNIGRCAFYNLKKVTKVTLPEGLESIDDYAFNGCKALTEIAIHESVTISETAFESGVTLNTVSCSHDKTVEICENRKAATCTTAGSYDVVVYCTSCNVELSREATLVFPTDHSEVKMPAVPPSVESEGSTEWIFCSYCGEILSERRVIPKLVERFSIKYINSGAINPNPISYTADDEIVLRAPYYNGLEFLYWRNAATGESVTSIPKGSTGDLILVGVFKSNANLVTNAESHNLRVISDSAGLKKHFIFDVGCISNVRISDSAWIDCSLLRDENLSISKTVVIGNTVSQDIVNSIGKSFVSSFEKSVSNANNTKFSITNTLETEAGVEKFLKLAATAGIISSTEYENLFSETSNMSFTSENLYNVMFTHQSTYTVNVSNNFQINFSLPEDLNGYCCVGQMAKIAISGVITYDPMSDSYTCTLVAKIVDVSISAIYAPTLDDIPEPEFDDYEIPYADIRAALSKMYTINFDDGRPPLKLLPGEEAILPTASYLFGKRVIGYEYNSRIYRPGESVSDLAPSGSSIELKVLYEPIDFSISFDSAGGTECSHVTATYGKPIGALPSSSRKYHKFLGWYNARGEKVSSETICGGDTHLTARWLKTWYSEYAAITNGWYEVDDGYEGNFLGLNWRYGAKRFELSQSSSLNKAELKRHGYTMVEISITINCWEIEPGDKYIHLYNTAGTELDCKEMTFTWSKKNAQSYTVRFYVNIDSLDDNCRFYVRFTADGKGSDAYAYNYIEATVIAYKPR